MLDLGWATGDAWWWAAMAGGGLLVVIAGVLLVRLALDTRHGWSELPSPERVLDQRLAHGEISMSEYCVQRDLLRS